MQVNDVNINDADMFELKLPLSTALMLLKLPILCVDTISRCQVVNGTVLSNTMRDVLAADPRALNPTLSNTPLRTPALSAAVFMIFLVVSADDRTSHYYIVDYGLRVYPKPTFCNHCSSGICTKTTHCSCNSHGRHSKLIAHRRLNSRPRSSSGRECYQSHSRIIRNRGCVLVSAHTSWT